MPGAIIEVQLDGLVGPTHHFAGLAHGNLASQQHAGWRSNPRAAARQGLAKMRQVMELGVVQALLPPLPRPDLSFLRRCGFSGDARAVLRQAAAEPYLLRLASSSAFMWTANAATAAPGCDTIDGRGQLLAANLVATPHRALEGCARAEQLRRLFADPAPVAVHDPLPATSALADEGAANHSRLTSGAAVAHLFVYGRAGDLAADQLPQRFPARQSREASAAVARRLGLRDGLALFARQHPAAIDAGAFHNDVVMVGCGNRLLVHETALVDQAAVLAELLRRLPELRIFQVADRELSLAEAVRSYLFNSQLLDTPAGTLLLAPAQAATGAPALQVRRMLDQGFIARVEFIELGESMANGGGPACLRLRLPLSATELAALRPGVVLDAGKIQALEHWVDSHYRDTLAPEDLADPELADEGRAALAELAGLLAFDDGSAAVVAEG